MFGHDQANPSRRETQVKPKTQLSTRSTRCLIYSPVSDQTKEISDAIHIRSTKLYVCVYMRLRKHDAIQQKSQDETATINTYHFHHTESNLNRTTASDVSLDHCEIYSMIPRHTPWANKQIAIQHS